MEEDFSGFTDSDCVTGEKYRALTKIIQALENDIYKRNALPGMRSLSIVFQIDTFFVPFFLAATPSN